MDGNRRWASKNNLHWIEGYKTGVKVAEQAVELAIDSKIPNLTLYTMSADNLNRPKEQVSFLFNLLKSYLLKNQNILKDKNVCLKVIGSEESLPKSLIKAMHQAEEESKDNAQLNLYLAVNYGGRQEILDACKKLVANNLQGEQINTETFEKCLYAPEMPNLDYVIRTGNSERISDFLLWKISYSELYFLKALWPDVTKKHLKTAIESFQTRSRTFGKSQICKI